MRKSIKTIGTIVTMEIMLVSAYWLGTTKAETVTQIEEIEKIVDAISDGYIDMYLDEFRENFVDMRDVTYFKASDNGLQLYFVDGSGYWWEYRCILLRLWVLMLIAFSFGLKMCPYCVIFKDKSGVFARM